MATTTTEPPGTRMGWPGGSPADTVLASVMTVGSVLAVVAEVTAYPGSQPPAWPAILLAVASGAPLLMRRSRPGLATTLVAAIVAVYHFSGYPGLGVAMPMFAAVYSCGAYARGRWGWLAGLGGVAAIHVIPALPPNRLPWEAYAITGPVVGAATFLVVGVAARRRRLDGEERVRQAAETARAQVQQRLAEDRLAIARELHDVLAHTISVIIVQSGAALDAMDTDPEAARTAMRAVRGTARRALPDLRGALTVLRGQAGSSVESAGSDQPVGGPGSRSGGLAQSPLGQPAGAATESLLAQPRLSDLPDLVAQVGATGLRVDLSCAVDGEGAAPMVELTAYRIVQEALTNVVRHAAASRATVTVSPDGDDIVVTVADDGRGMDPGADGSGHGLAGMGERAALVGGECAVGPGPDGRGVAVRARLPWMRVAS